MDRRIFAVSRLVLLVGFVVGLFWVISGEAENLVPNGDFEEGLSGYEALGADAKRFFVIDSTAKSGSKSLVCLPTTEKITLRRFNIVLDPNKQYTLTVAMKSEDAEFGQITGVFVINASWYWASNPLKPTEATSDWKDYSLTFTPKVSSDGKYQVVILPQTKGKLWIDNIRLVESGKVEAAVTPATPAQTGNLVQNSSFENDLANWVVWSNVARYFLIDTNASKGSKSLAVLGYEEKGQARQSNIVLDPNKQYTLSAYMKLEEMEAQPFTGVFIINSGWSWASGPNKGLRPEEPTSDWKRYSLTFTPKVSSDGKYQVVIWGPTKGKLWIDAIQLEEGTTATEYK